MQSHFERIHLTVVDTEGSPIQELNAPYSKTAEYIFQEFILLLNRCVRYTTCSNCFFR